MPHPAGAIIVVSILVAASIAAYENDNVRAWVERTRQTITTSLNNITDDFRPKRAIAMRTLQKDASMKEDDGDAAKAKREEMKAQLADRARILEARARRKSQRTSGSLSPSFDSMVDQDGNLRGEPDSPRTPTADASAVQASHNNGQLHSRYHKSGELAASQPLPVTQQNVADLEREMRSAFRLPIPDQSSVPTSSHASESLLDLTPTTEDFPDPDYSIPSAAALNGRTRRSDYFSTAASSHTVSDTDPQFYYAHPSRPYEPIEGRSQTLSPAVVNYSLSSAPSVAGSTSLINPSDADISEDDLISEPDGIRTPASAWTEVGSSVSGDDRLLH